MKRLSLIVLLFLLVATVAGSSSPALAQSSDSVYISETGHWIWGEFLHAYNSVTDPLLYFGYPLTDDFIDPVTKTRVQYFEKARFDLVETVDGAQIQMAPLGQLLHESGARLADIPNDGPTCRSFISGYSVCYAFLQFYDAYDGANRFGSPISEVEIVDGRYVQYFDYVRMEWWPDRPAGKRVVLSDLGRIYFDKVVADAELLKPSPPADLVGNLINPKVNVFTLKSLIGIGEAQTVFIVVRDQYLRAVEGAQVGVTLIFPDGSKENYRLPETNEYGVSQFSFTTIEMAIRSTVNIRVEVNIRGETGSGRSWYRIWW